VQQACMEEDGRKMGVWVPVVEVSGVDRSVSVVDCESSESLERSAAEEEDSAIGMVDGGWWRWCEVGGRVGGRDLCVGEEGGDFEDGGRWWQNL